MFQIYIRVILKKEKKEFLERLLNLELTVNATSKQLDDLTMLMIAIRDSLLDSSK